MSRLCIGMWVRKCSIEAVDGALESVDESISLA